MSPTDEIIHRHAVNIKILLEFGKLNKDSQESFDKLNNQNTKQLKEKIRV